MSKAEWFTSKKPEDGSPFWWLRWVPMVVVSAIVLYIIYLIGSVVVVPVLVSFALAYLLSPIVYAAEKRGLSRPVAAIGAILIFSLAIAGFLSYVVPDMWAEGTKAGRKIAQSFTPENAKRQRNWLRRYSPALERVAGDRIEQILSDPARVVGETTIESETGQAEPLTTVAMKYFISGLDLILVPFFVFYILVDFQRWRESLETLIPPRFRDPFSVLFDESGRILESYVRGQIVIGLIMAALYALGFWALGVPAWAGIALIAGLLNAVPYIGTIIGVLLASAFTMAEGGGAWEIAAVLGVFVAVQSLEGYFLTPKILGERLNVHPMAVFLGLLIGGKLFGFLGFVIAIPGIAISKVFLKFGRELYEASYFYHADDLHPGEAPPGKVEERIAEAQTVLAEQVSEDE